MARFNPDVPDQDKSFKGYSEGAQPIRAQEAAPALRAPESVSAAGATYSAIAAQKKAQANASGGLTEGLGRIFGDVVRAADFVVQETIGDQLRTQTEQIKNEFGVGAMAIGQADISLTPPPTPSGLQEAGGQLDSLTQAYQSGRLQASHYWARLESMVRQMKTRYPGYQDEIDRKVSSLTGATPSNVLRAQLQQQADDALSAMGDTAKRYQSLVTELAKNGELNVIAPDFQQRSQSGNPYTFEELVAKTADYKERDARTSRVVSDIQLDESLGKQTKEKASLAANDMANQVIGDIMNGTVLVNQKSWDDLYKNLDQAVGGSLPTDQVEQLSNTFTQLKESAINTFRKRALALGGSLDPADRKAIEGTLIDQFDQIQKDLVSGDHSALKQDMRAVQIQQDKLTRDLFNNQDFALASTMREKLGPELAFEVASKSDLLTNVEKGVNDMIANRLMSNKAQSLSKEMDKLKESQAQPAAYAELTKQAASIISNPRIPADEKKATVRAVFSDDFLNRFEKAPNLRYQMYSALTSPEVVKSMIANKGKDPMGFEAYKKWVVDQAQGHILQDAATIQAGVQYSDTMTFTYDEKSHHIVFHSNPGSGDWASGPQRAWEAYQAPKVEASVNRVNQAFDAIAPLYDDPAEQIYRTLQLAGINTHAVNESSGFLTKINRAVSSFIIDRNKTREEAARKGRDKAANDAVLTPQE